MKIDPIVRDSVCNSLNGLFNIMFVALICRRFLRWGVHTLTADVAHLP